MYKNVYRPISGKKKKVYVLKMNKVQKTQSSSVFSIVLYDIFLTLASISSNVVQFWIVVAMNRTVFILIVALFDDDILPIN